MSRFDDHLERGIATQERELGITGVAYVAPNGDVTDLDWAVVGEEEDRDVDLSDRGRNRLSGRRVDVRTSEVPTPAVSTSKIRIPRDEDATTWDDWPVVMILERNATTTALFVVRRDQQDVHAPGHYTDRLT